MFCQGGASRDREDFVYTPSGQMQILYYNSTFEYSFVPNSQYNWRYGWRGGRVSLDQDYTDPMNPNNKGAFIDKFDQLIYLNGREYDTTTGAPLQTDLYAFFRPDSKYSTRSALLAADPSAGTSLPWQDIQLQVQRYTLQVGLTGLAMGTSLVLGGAFGLVGAESVAGTMALAVGTSFVQGASAGFIMSYGSGQSAGQVAKATAIGGATSALGGLAGAATARALGGGAQASIIQRTLAGTAGGAVGGTIAGAGFGYAATGTWAGTRQGALYGMAIGAAAGGMTAFGTGIGGTRGQSGAAGAAAAESGMSIAARQQMVAARTAEQVALRGRAADFLYQARSGVSVPRTAVAAEEAVEARGGVYLLRDVETGQVMRTGRTNDLLRRQGEHFRDPLLIDYRFEPVYRTDVYAEQRGLEQELDWIHNPPLNYKRPIDPNSSNLLRYLRAANNYLDKAQGIP